MNSPPEKIIVMVDDEKSYVELLASILQEHLNRRVVTFTRPQEALAALSGLNPGMIITDYFMPQLNGFEFAARAAELHPGVPMLLITGHTIEIPDSETKPLPFRELLQKPFGGRTLAEAVIRHWTDGRADLPAS